MKPLWFPTSALIDGELECWAAPVMVRLPLAAGSAVELRYVGDRMWPAFRTGASIEVLPLSGPPAAGSAVVAILSGNIELCRVVACDASRVTVCGDADSEPPRELPLSDLIGRVDAPRRRFGPLGRAFRRARLDLAEAGASRPERPADSVREKYERQAEAYAMHGIKEFPPPWQRAVRTHLGESGALLVVGSGTGQECFALARLGFDVLGVDFSPAMVEQAERLAERAASPRVRFRATDVLDLSVAAQSLRGVLFTPDVFSFIPVAADRRALLQRIAGWLEPSGRLLLSARIAAGGWRRAMLAVQWLAGVGSRAYGDSHTRFLVPDGSLRRSFVHCFGERSLRREYRGAGFRECAHEAGFHVLVPREAEVETG